jgi:hypothetical protein
MMKLLKKYIYSTAIAASFSIAACNSGNGPNAASKNVDQSAQAGGTISPSPDSAGHQANAPSDSGGTVIQGRAIITQDTANAHQDVSGTQLPPGVVRTHEPIHVPITVTPTVEGTNPPHGAPGHDCSIPVGAPLKKK